MPQAFAEFSVVAWFGFYTAGVALALVLIAAGVRLMQSYVSVKDYDAVLDKLNAIETKIAAMTQAAQAMHMDYEKNLAAEKAAHEREIFSLQQLVFERNSEIISLKTSLQELQKSSQFETY